MLIIYVQIINIEFSICIHNNYEITSMKIHVNLLLVGFKMQYSTLILIKYLKINSTFRVNGKKINLIEKMRILQLFSKSDT